MGGGGKNSVVLSSWSPSRAGFRLLDEPLSWVLGPSIVALAWGRVACEVLMSLWCWNVKTWRGDEENRRSGLLLYETDSLMRRGVGGSEVRVQSLIKFAEMRRSEETYD